MSVTDLLIKDLEITESLIRKIKIAMEIEVKSGAHISDKLLALYVQNKNQADILKRQIRAFGFLKRFFK